MAVAAFDLNSKAWVLFDREVGSDEFRQIATAILMFVAIGHCIHWVTDWVSYSKWFQTNKVPLDNLFSMAAFKKSTSNMIIGLSERVRLFQDNLKMMDAEVSKFDEEVFSDLGEPESFRQAFSVMKAQGKNFEKWINEREREISEISDVISDIGPGFKSLSWMAWITLYVWYLIVPVGMSFFAVALLW